MEVETAAELRPPGPSADRRFLGRAEPLTSGADFAELTEASHDAVISFDQSGVICSWNTAAARLFGYAGAEALGRPATDLVFPEEIATQHARIVRVLDGERIHRVAVTGRRRDGSSVPMTVTMVPIERGRGGCVIARDLTEEHVAQTTLAEAELRLHQAEELSHVGLWLWDSATDALQMSDELHRIHGVEPIAFEGTMAAYVQTVHPEDLPILQGALAAYVDDDDGLEVEYRIIRPDGAVVWVYSRAEMLYGADGRPVGLRGVGQDVTDRKHAAEALREQASMLELLRRMAVAANEAADLEQALRSSLRDVCAHTGWPVGHVVFVEGERVVPSWILHTTDLTRYGPLLEAARSDPPGISPFVHQVLTTHRPVVAPVLPGGGDPLDRMAGEAGLDTVIAFPLTVGAGVVAVLQFYGRGRPKAELVTTVWDGANQLGRVVERARSRDELSHRALHDALTGLPNRTLLMDRLGHALASQADERGIVALIFVDLDNFKLINDSLGHEAGDDLVVRVARRLERVLRPEDTAARLGGDEFIVLCDHLATEEDAIDVVERILAAIAEPMSLQGETNTVITASAGIAIALRPGIAPDALLRDADLAMYRAKETGRGRYQIFDSEMNRRARNRLTLANELRTAIGAGQLRLLYQPQVDTVTGALLGVEALVRWQHPTRGWLGPLEFIPVAEETHLIVPLGGWVLNEACRQAAEWHTLFPHRRPLKMCVNVSPKQLSRPELIDDVAIALAQSDLPAGSLCIEITESVLMSDAEFFLEALLGLKMLGVDIAIDDFGTGYSSLAYLRRYPIDVIKVDKGFVDGLDGDDPRPTAVMAAVVDLAHALGVIALAEGVETAAQRTTLRNLGCDECQGFFFARPAPPAAITALLAGADRLGEGATIG